MKSSISFFTIFLLVLFVSGSVNAQQECYIYCTDDVGVVKEEFLPTDSVYGIGQFYLYTYSCSSVGEVCSGNIDLYTVLREGWTGDVGQILFDAGAGIESVTVSGTCIDTDNGPQCKVVMPLTLIWEAETVPGEYVFVIDIDQDGLLDQGDLFVEFSIPEYIIKPFFTAGAGLYGSTPAIGSDGTIYVGSNDSCLYAINPDGTLKWKYYTGDKIHYSSPVIGDDGVIYIGSFSKGLFAVNPDGTLNFNFLCPYPFSSMILATPAVDCNNGKVYFGTLDNYVYSVNTDGSFNWQYETGRYIHSAPAIGTDGTVYIGSTDGVFYALNPEDGSLKWQYETGDQIEHSSPAIDADGTIYVGSQDGVLYAFNPDGTVKWSYETSLQIGSPPVIAEDGSIYFAALWEYYALDNNGDLKWKIDIIEDQYYLVGETGTFTIGSDGTLYCGTGNMDGGNKFFAISQEGVLLWEEPVGGRIYSSPALSDDGIAYVASTSGSLYAFDTGTNAGLANSPWPKFAHDARNTGCAHEVENIREIVENIKEYIEEMDPAKFDNPAHQNALINQLEALAAEIEDLNPTAALARLNNIRNRVEKWVEDEEDKAAILEMIDRLIAYFESQDASGKGNGKGKKGASLSAAKLISKMQLLQNNPNPFNPSTTISYSVPEGASERITLKVYNLRGRLVRTLVQDVREAGNYTVFWDGTDETGRRVSSGVYFYRIQAGEFVQTRKMVLVK
ncbi:MAG TPA: PQQ-binding-like beta-propeller repeat protein [archaeon]|nr:PQQ-binding-like beta-propeller repeat protein [archaeon]